MKPSTLKGYREKIRAACRSVGTYKPEFEVIIARLAGYYLRDHQLDELYTDTGSQPIVKAKGSPLAVKNPILDEKDRLARFILDLERELGLTPAALRKINEAALAAKQAEDPLAAALAGLRGGGGP